MSMPGKEIGKAAVGSMLLGMVQTNCYFVYKEDGKDHEYGSKEKTPVVFFDPADNGDRIYEALTDRGFVVDAIYLTHGHFDHMAGAKKLKELSGAKIYACEKERHVFGDPYINLSVPFTGWEITIEPDEYLKDGAICEAAGFKFKLIETPGHTVGSCCYYFEEDNILICGDTIFEGSVGRTDFPEGSAATLVRSIQERIFTLPGDTILLPSHGGDTTVGFEKDHNPYTRLF